MTGGPSQFDRVLADTLAKMPEWAPTYRLDQHVSEARERMGETRWRQLNAEWEA